jgi:hypothetical protein
MPAKKATAPKTHARTQRAADPVITPASVGELSPNPRNPRKPWKDTKTRDSFLHSLQSFGDLSGIVYNLTSKQLVGGHKRVAEFKADGAAANLCVTDRLSHPDASGSVAYGYVEMSNGVRFAYREVQWDKAKEAAANLAANKWGAEWDLPAVVDMLAEAQAGGFDIELTGFDLPEVEELLAGGGGTGDDGENDNDGDGGDDNKTTNQKLLAVLSEIKEPKQPVERGQCWKLGDHVLFCASLVKDSIEWAGVLSRACAAHGSHSETPVMFLACPDPYAFLTEKDVVLVGIQPDPFVAGHIVSNYAKEHGSASASLVQHPSALFV